MESMITESMITESMITALTDNANTIEPKGLPSQLLSSTVQWSRHMVLDGDIRGGMK